MNLGIQPARDLMLVKRGLLVPKGADVEWDKLFPKGFRASQKTGGGAQFCLDHGLAMVL